MKSSAPGRIQDSAAHPSATRGRVSTPFLVAAWQIQSQRAQYAVHPLPVPRVADRSESVEAEPKPQPASAAPRARAARRSPVDPQHSDPSAGGTTLSARVRRSRTRVESSAHAPPPRSPRRPLTRGQRYRIFGGGHIRRWPHSPARGSAYIRLSLAFSCSSSLSGGATPAPRPRGTSPSTGSRSDG